MTNRELLELAAKASGRDADWVDFAGMDLRVGYQGGMLCGDADSGYYWNPLEDDGDALRLAARLDIETGRAMGNAWWAKRFTSSKVFIESIERPDGSQDPNEAIRRAIVRAAAEIGKAD